MNIVSTITGERLKIERSGRLVLDIPQVQLGRFKSTAIVGPNGAGKSLLVKSLAALMMPDSGDIKWNSTPADNNRRNRVGLLLQRPVLLNRTALKNLTYALRAAGVGRQEAVVQARAALESAGLGAVVEVLAPRLSGGEQQRLALARALALKPDMLFLDEATANVDPASTQAIEEQLKRAVNEGLTIVFVSHDMGQVKRMADEVILMHKGQIVEQSPSVDFFKHTVNPITRAWLAGEILL
ncbi:MAG: ATP-binding cassette domain-containing protein [Granulosicoccus sp.]